MRIFKTDGMGDTVNVKMMLIAVGLAVLVLTQMAAAGPGGSLKHNTEMTRAFKNGNPPADLRYYATGRENVPDAVIGLDPQWQQTAKFWREIGPDAQDVIKMVSSLRRYGDNEPRASDIVTPGGEVVGVYWSSVYWTTVKMGEGNRVQVYKPRVSTRL